MIMAGLISYRVTRLPGAPRRRAGRVWDEGETIADLDQDQLMILDAAIGYRVEPVIPDLEPEPDPRVPRQTGRKRRS